MLDPRLTPARPDLAASHLRGRVAAERFADGEAFSVLDETVDMKRLPRPDAPLETQLLHGETLVVYDDDNGWGWAQADRDGYVGYVAMSALGRVVVAPTHRTIVRRAHIYPAADMKQPVIGALPLDGRVAVEDSRGAFLKIGGHGFVVATHLAPLDRVAPDPVDVAESLLGTPYLWGGKSPLGIDCSGLVQLSHSMAGRSLPRDTDMQEALGLPLDLDEGLTALHRGDLVFWKGHVGIMADSNLIVHANAHHMLVEREHVLAARDRIAATGNAISSIRRFSPIGQAPN
jgi:cell wall-associated NlpC family hydrolase